MARRKIVKIIESLCDGCGICVEACAEGAIRIENGHAVVTEGACDGLGACVGPCPRGAITIEEREAVPFDMKKVKRPQAHRGHACPGARARQFAGGGSALRQWPVQIELVPPGASFLEGSDLLIAADCTAFAYASFHSELLEGKVLLVGCPKLDDTDSMEEKFVAILEENNIRSVTSVHMEAPCCFGLLSIVTRAIARSEKKIPFKDIVITVDGNKN